MTTEPEKKRKIKLSRVLLLSFIFILIIGFGSGLGLLLGIVKDLPDWDAAGLESESTSFVYDINGDMVVKLHRAENRVPVKLDAIPDNLINAFLATEDVRFWEHHGVDVKRVFGALAADIRNRNFSEGASTLTMQLVRNAILEDQDKKIERKIKEALLAIQVERNYTKDEILTMYLNEIYFGHGTHGVQTASQLYFGKDVGELTLGESAMLTGLVRNPRNYSPFLNLDNAIHIRNVVLNNMLQYGMISQEEADQAKQEKPKLADYQQQNLYAYPWFTDYVIDQAEDLIEAAGMEPSQIYTGGLRIHTTLDPVIQKAAEDAYANESFFPASNTNDPVQSAMAVMDPKTGEVRALIGGREHLTKRGLNRATDIKRQPGSAFKPISVYAPALEDGFAPSSRVNDVPTTFGSSKYPYKPVNYDGRYRGSVTMRKAVEDSINVPAVKFLSMIGVSKGYTFAKNLGLDLDKNDENLSLALGGLTYGVSPLALTAAYCAFDNQGVYIKPHVITKIVDQYGNTIVDVVPEKKIAMNERTAYLMTDMLESVVKSGTGTRAQMNRPVAGKTGTTQLPDKAIFNSITGSANKDAWFAGYTPELVGVVWMGYDQDVDKDGKPNYLRQVYGGQYPARIWKYVMENSLKEVPVSSFTKPTGIVSKAIDIKTGKLASSLTPDKYIRYEVFSNDNIPTEYSDAWITANICSDSKLLANEECPNQAKGVFLKASYASQSDIDAGLTAPTAHCNIHKGAESAIGTEMIGICTDPRHKGKLVLANYPQEGESGGCPQDLIQFRSFESGEVPTKHCDLKDHQVKK
ncbi:penicillin-binding protein 1A [Dehalobacterium formicoaceticum]|uniref:transglycosylase domain-containing protein n=1 Tax=Dehalobacterium formicoaceticum TaxID=51515 RepID=UPI0031F7106A